MMDWQPPAGFAGNGFESYYGALDGTERPRFATNPLDFPSYGDGGLDNINNWSYNGEVTVRPLEERISAGISISNDSAHHQNHSLNGINGIVGFPVGPLGGAAHTDLPFHGERIGSHQVQMPATIPGISMRRSSSKAQTPTNVATTNHQNTVLNTADGNMSEQARLEKAADLRAKLKASLAMRSGGTTPGRDTGPRDKVNVDQAKPAANATKIATARNKPQVVDDLEGLVAEARAAAEAKDVAQTHRDNVENTIAEFSDTSPADLEKPENLPLKMSEVRQSWNNDGSSSEASEQGEIRETSMQQARVTGLTAQDRKETEPKVKEDSVLLKTVSSDKAKDTKRSFVAKEKLATETRDRRNPETARLLLPKSSSAGSCTEQTETLQADPSAFKQPQQDTPSRAGYGENGLGSPRLPKHKPRESNNTFTSKDTASSLKMPQAVVSHQKEQTNPLNAPHSSSDILPADKHSHHDVQPRQEIPSEINSYYEDLEDWLEMTGYHDRPYRTKALKRHQALIALEIQKAKLEREAQIEHEERVLHARAQSIIPLEVLKDSPLRPAHRSISASASSILSMAPPPLPVRADLAVSGQSDSAHSASASGSTAPRSTNEADQAPYLQTPPSSNLKRRFSNVDGACWEFEPAEKHARVERDGHVDHHGSSRLETNLVKDDKLLPMRRTHPYSKDENVRTRGRSREPQERKIVPTKGYNGQRLGSPSPLPPRITRSYEKDSYRRVSDEDTRFVQRGESPSHRGSHSRDASPSYVRAYNYRVPSRSSSYVHPARHEYHDDHAPPKHWDDSIKGSVQQLGDKQNHISESSRGRGRGRGATYSNRGRGSLNKFARQEQKGAGSLDLREDTRFFLVKSWNHENVQTSQHDNLWATQEKNTRLFTDAFKSCRNVILVFSVNKSTAFQGYARMESAPGAAPTPTWVKNLLWPSSPPFRIRWITIADTKFHLVGHLKNSLNENQAVLIGRDGQEIEPSCGAALCELIDENDTRS